ncbi:MAG TPA: winged helix DNA-binding domain-containing protein, partial [Dehalococcoidia bacterium]
MRSRDTPAARLQSQQTSHAVASPGGERRGGDSIDLAHRRLISQQIAVHASNTPAEIVAALGAVQAQDYAGGKWAIALRLPHATDEGIEHAIVDRTIVRTWPMRGTLHFVAAADVRWLLDLLAPRMIARAAARHRQLELDDATFSRARRVVTKALEGGRQLTRDALYRALEEAHVPVGPHATGERRGFHILWRLAHERLICFGARGGKQQTLVLLDEWLGPPPPPLSRDEALAMLAERYFTAHGPATVADFTWWSSLAAAEARRALDIIKPRFQSEVLDGATYWFANQTRPSRSRRAVAHLLPPYDEYLVGYRDRSAALDPAHSDQAPTLLSPTIVIGGRVVGTWGRTFAANSVTLSLHAFRPLTSAEQTAVSEATRRYADFLDLPL